MFRAKGRAERVRNGLFAQPTLRTAMRDKEFIDLAVIIHPSGCWPNGKRPFIPSLFL